MATYFFDTSALIKYYHTERGSNRVTQLFQAPGAEVLISRLGVTEVHSSLAKKVRQGDLAKEDFMDVLHRGDFSRRKRRWMLRWTIGVAIIVSTVVALAFYWLGR